MVFIIICHGKFTNAVFFVNSAAHVFTVYRAEAFTSLQQDHLQIITIIYPARDSSKQTVTRDIFVMACQSFSVNDCMCYLKIEQ